MSEEHVKGSWLRKLVSIHERPARTFTLEVGRLAGVKFAVRWVPAEVRRDAADESRKWLIARGWAPEDLYGGTGAQAHEFESRVRVLAKALVNPENFDELACANADEIRRLFDADEILFLWDQFDAFCVERNPWRHWKNAAEFEADVDAYVKGLMPTTWLLSFESASLRSIVTFMGSRLQQRTRGSSSATSQQSGSGSESTSSDAPDATTESP